MPIILQKETNFLEKEPEVLEKLIKLAGEGGVADNSVEVRAGEIFRQSAEAEENAAVLEKLEKNGAKFFIRSWWIVHEGF